MPRLLLSLRYYSRLRRQVVLRMTRGLFSFGKLSARWMWAKILSDLGTLITTVAIIDRVTYLIMVAISESLTQELLFNTMIIMAFILVVRFLLLWTSSKAVANISSKIKIEIRDQIYSKILELELGYRDDKRTGGIVTTIMEGVESLEVFYGRFFPQIFISILSPMILFFYIAQFSYSIALTLILTIPLIPISIGVVQVWVRRTARMHWSTYEDLNAYYLDSLQGLTTLKLFGQTGNRIEEISKRSWDFRDKTMRLLYANLSSILVMDLVAMLGTALGIMLAITHLHAGLIGLQAALLVLFVSYEFFRPFRQLGSYFHFAVNGMSAFNSISEILNQEPRRNELGECKDFEFGPNLDIEFKNVEFSYEDYAVFALRGINLKAKTGQITAIVGKSGSGKTTIADLITRLHDPKSGRIWIGSFDLQTLCPKDIRREISVISQRSYLFHGSIRENLLIAKPDATDDELYWACEQAGIIDFVKSLPEGLDSSLVEQAKNISSGQIQRVAIARALLKNTRILILDEPTSNVDADNEEKIMRTLESIAEHKTTILISHRLSTVRRADMIALIDKGIIVEQGTHDELMKKEGTYAELFRDHTVVERASGARLVVVG